MTNYLESVTRWAREYDLDLWCTIKEMQQNLRVDRKDLPCDPPGRVTTCVAFVRACLEILRLRKEVLHLQCQYEEGRQG